MHINFYCYCCLYYSLPAATMDFDIDVAKLSDPVECFAAFERMESKL